jgi:hypothetical protein
MSQSIYLAYSVNLIRDDKSCFFDIVKPYPVCREVEDITVVRGLFQPPNQVI